MLILFMMLQLSFGCSILSFPSRSPYDQILFSAERSELAPLLNADQATTKKFVFFLEELYKHSKDPDQFLRNLKRISFSLESNTLPAIHNDGHIILPKILKHNPLALAEAYRTVFLIENGDLATSTFRAQSRLEIALNSYAAVYEFVREVYSNEDFQFIDKNLSGPTYQVDLYQGYSQKPFFLDQPTYASTIAEDFETKKQIKQTRTNLALGFGVLGYGIATAGGIGYLVYYLTH